MLRGVRRTFRSERRRAAGAARRRPDAAAPARSWHWSRRRAPANRRCCISPGCWSGRTAARCWSRAATPARCPTPARTAIRRDTHRLRLPVPSSAGGVHRAGERGAAADDRRQVAHARPRTGRRRCWRRSGWRRARSICPASCPAASSSGWRSRARWPTRRRCCWPTNRPAISMSGPRRRCSRNCCATVREHGVAALIATHNPELAARMDRTVTLRDGSVVSL